MNKLLWPSSLNFNWNALSERNLFHILRDFKPCTKLWDIHHLLVISWWNFKRDFWRIQLTATASLHTPFRLGWPWTNRHVGPCHHPTIHSQDSSRHPLVDGQQKSGICNVLWREYKVCVSCWETTCLLVFWSNYGECQLLLPLFSPAYQ